jgi:hypothetical protein
MKKRIKDHAYFVVVEIGSTFLSHSPVSLQGGNNITSLSLSLSYLCGEEKAVLAWRVGYGANSEGN